MADLLHLTYFDEFIKALDQLEPKFARKVKVSSARRTQKMLVAKEKSILSRYRKRTGYLRKSVKGRIRVKKGVIRIIAGIRDPKPPLKRSRKSDRLKPRPSTYGGIWLNFGVAPHDDGDGTHPGFEGSDWVNQTWNSSASQVEAMLVEDMKKAIREAFNGVPVQIQN